MGEKGKTEEGSMSARIRTSLIPFITLAPFIPYGRILSRSIRKAVLYCLTTFIFLNLMIAMGGCANMKDKDSMSNLSFSHDGKKVLFDRCRDNTCQIQVYDLETGELAAYQSPANEQWTMARQSHDGKRIVFSVMPIAGGRVDLGGMQIAVMDVDGKNYRKVTTGKGAKLYPVFSHSGKKVLYARAAYIRGSGKTPAAQYDAWEVDLATGRQTQLTFFKYFYMSNLSYFPDDERFIYYGELPEAFPGEDINIMKLEEAMKQAQMKHKVNIGGVIVMRKGDALPKEHYTFGTGFFARSPLLSRDGSKLVIEKGMSGGKFFLYSTDGNHRLLVSGGSVDSATMSPDGELFGMISVSLRIRIYSITDGKFQQSLYLSCTPNKIENWNIRPEFRHLQQWIPDKPAHIVYR